MKIWQLQEAKANLSRLVQEAKYGPQEITLHGKAAVVVISKKEYEHLTQPKLSFVDFLRNSPLVGVKLIIGRNKSLTRKTEL